MMRRVVLWGMIAVLGMPVIAMADEPTSSPGGSNKTVESTFPSSGAFFDFVPGGVIQLTGPGGVSQTTEAKDSKFWIGLSCAPLDGALRSQLGLEDGSGLVVRQIADNSSAKDAGILVHDIITEVIIGDEKHKPADVTQLTALVQKAETKPVTFVLLRRGKPLNIAVTPKERNSPNNSPQNLPVTVPGRLPAELHPSFFRMAGPVLAFGGPPPFTTNLQDDVTVIITKSGSQPVEVTVRQKDRGEWKLKEKEAAVQPNNVSQAVIGVLQHLSGLAWHVNERDGQQVFTLEPGAQFNFAVAQPSNPSRGGTDVRARTPVKPSTAIQYRKYPTMFSLEERLDQIQKQQEQVTKALDELRQTVQKSQPQN
jgi:hypothetical protein